MTIDQLTQCLGYKQRRGVDLLVKRNQYLCDKEFSVENRLYAADGKAYMTRLFTEDGIYEVSFLSTTDKAKEFRSFARKMIKAYRKGELIQTPQQLQNTTMIIALTQTVSNLSSQLTKLQQNINTLQRTTYQMRNTVNPYKRQSNWKKIASDKIKALTHELNLEDGKQILRNIYTVMRTDYGKDINTYTDLYAIEHPNENRLNGFDTVNHFEELQCLFDSILDNYTELFKREE